jgi:hypothetical protein
VDRLKTTARVLVDRKEVIGGRTPFYESSPGMVHFGENPEEDGARAPCRISGIVRLTGAGVPAPASEPGIWRADIVVPWLAPYVAHPVLGSGVARHGNLLLVDVPAPDELRFGYDIWGVGISWSRALKAVPGIHRVEIFVGPQVARQKWPAAWHLDPGLMGRSATVLNVWWDGNLVWSREVTANGDSYGLVSLGTNPQGFSTSDVIFPNGITFKPYSRQETREFVARNLAGAR